MLLLNKRRTPFEQTSDIFPIQRRSQRQLQSGAASLRPYGTHDCRLRLTVRRGTGILPVALNKAPDMGGISLRQGATAGDGGICLLDILARLARFVP